MNMGSDLILFHAVNTSTFWSFFSVLGNEEPAHEIMGPSTWSWSFCIGGANIESPSLAIFSLHCSLVFGHLTHVSAVCVTRFSASLVEDDAALVKSGSWPRMEGDDVGADDRREFIEDAWAMGLMDGVEPMKDIMSDGASDFKYPWNRSSNIDSGTDVDCAGVCQDVRAFISKL